ncbi:putative Bifunctional hydroxylase/dehydrase [Plantibacter sp. T3]|nr:putative Bifunctional hydroxylase/dehydrase [Plantibacter sp. T3]
MDGSPFHNVLKGHHVSTDLRPRLRPVRMSTAAADRPPCRARRDPPRPRHRERLRGRRLAHHADPRDRVLLECGCRLGGTGRRRVDRRVPRRQSARCRRLAPRARGPAGGDAVRADRSDGFLDDSGRKGAPPVRHRLVHPRVLDDQPARTPARWSAGRRPGRPRSDRRRRARRPRGLTPGPAASSAHLRLGRTRVHPRRDGRAAHRERRSRRYRVWAMIASATVCAPSPELTA